MESRGNLPMSGQLQLSSAGKVSRACQRCRRHKSRCDLFRPCTLCVRAEAECTSDSGGTPPCTKRRRVCSSGGSRSHAQVARPELDNAPLNDEARAINPVNTGSASPNNVRDAAEGDYSSLTPHSNVDYGGAESTMGITRKIFQLGSRDIDLRVTSAIPDGENLITGASQPLGARELRPILSILGYSLPSRPVVDLLLEEYFDSVHWFSLVIYEPLFRKEYESVADGLASVPQKPFLTLLTVVIAIAAWYRSQKHAVGGSVGDENWGAWSSELMRHTESQLFELMDRPSLTSVQVCILLGSFGVYHGKPNSSFALLGAAIKLAQALRLHREPFGGGFDGREERKRIWWTIYTWDRFASITYGRPLGINDKDCNVSMPSDVLEKPTFKYSGNVSIHYSAYQRELNTLYLIASPMIEAIFGTRSADIPTTAAKNERSAMISDIDEQLRQWHLRLPTHLVLDLKEDSQPHSPAQTRAHRLQALALQLTYDNIIIVLHRPFFAQQVHHLSRILPDGLQRSGSDSPAADTPQSIVAPENCSSEAWWNAAVRTSRVTELPNLAQSATDTHLVAFLAINLFNSAIVMVVCALSDPLSDRAQEAKRNITRIYRLQELLGGRSKLSMQSSVILQDVIRVLLNREAEAMLASVVVPSDRSHPEQNTASAAASYGKSRTVEDALRLPLDLPLGAVDFSGPARDASVEQQLYHSEGDGQVFERECAGYSAAGPAMGSGLRGENDLYWIWSSVADWP